MALSLQTIRRINPVVGASETDLPLGTFALDAYSSRSLRIDMVCSSVTAATGITAKLQNRAESGDWEDLGSANASVAITGNGTFSITMLIERAADQVDMPLRKTSRLVITTGVGDAVTFDNITFQTA